MTRSPSRSSSTRLTPDRTASLTAARARATTLPAWRISAISSLDLRMTIVPPGSGPVDVHGRADGELVVDPVHGRDRHADAPVAGRPGRHRERSMVGVAAAEVRRTVQQAQVGLAPGVDA